jgi:hypothetical protein
VIGSKPDRHLAAKVYLDQNPGGFEHFLEIFRPLNREQLGKFRSGSGRCARPPAGAQCRRA